jgi:hypothetical protein
MRSPIVIALLVLVGLAHAEQPVEEWGFLIPGEYHGDEAPEKPGKNWFALAVVDGRWLLEPTIVRATQIHDPVLDAEGGKSGIRISSKHLNAVALLRGPALRAGKVATPNIRFTDKASSNNITWRQPLHIEFKGSNYRIMVAEGDIFLAKGKQRTRLSDLTVSKDQDSDWSESASLQWAGDLDGDGELDLIISYSGYNRSGACLFLSSMGFPNELVGHVACHGGVGC